MTTIAYDGKHLSVDSKTTVGSTITSSKEQKMFKNIGIFSAIAFCGGTEYGREFIHEVLFRIASIEELRKTLVSAETDFVIIERATQFVFLYGLTKEDGIIVDRQRYSWAWGSGRSFGIAALDFGCTASEAIKYAATRDIYTNNVVRTYTLT